MFEQRIVRMQKFICRASLEIKWMCIVLGSVRVNMRRPVCKRTIRLFDNTPFAVKLL